ncbi:hypothetical protein G7Y89_g11251 [Cudoniella acicularis]|uniref:Uncharacterized protein n=1 Tax=Cudoniella acicularis TaxID=354080 RepID=A0A8H4RDV3_9HELO|nr:hypothetical protein G7Y89_g11251 [Cudoniella acicularis]
MSSCKKHKRCSKDGQDEGAYKNNMREGSDQNLARTAIDVEQEQLRADFNLDFGTCPRLDTPAEVDPFNTDPKSYPKPSNRKSSSTKPHGQARPGIWVLEMLYGHAEKFCNGADEGDEIFNVGGGWFSLGLGFSELKWKIRETREI